MNKQSRTERMDRSYPYFFNLLIEDDIVKVADSEKINKQNVKCIQSGKQNNKPVTPLRMVSTVEAEISEVLKKLTTVW